jgi:hypothetical protein
MVELRTFYYYFCKHRSDFGTIGYATLCNIEREITKTCLKICYETYVPLMMPT